MRIFFISCLPLVFPSFSFLGFHFPSRKAELFFKNSTVLCPVACCPGMGNYSQISFCQNEFLDFYISNWEWLNLGCLFLNFEKSLTFSFFFMPILSESLSVQSRFSDILRFGVTRLSLTVQKQCSSLVSITILKVLMDF